MSGNEMGYRGSKSLLINNIVKEQRVDGSWFLAKTARNLRCTLMGGESRYQIKIPSKQLIRKFSTKIYPSKVEPWFVTGFTDAALAGSLSIIIDKNNKRTLGWLA